jgi:hypothetical protein
MTAGVEAETVTKATGHLKAHLSGAAPREPAET